VRRRLMRSLAGAKSVQPADSTDQPEQYLPAPLPAQALTTTPCRVRGMLHLSAALAVAAQAARRHPLQGGPRR
jgi:hypothetical protein